jgi:alkanesulfonate monooxygenase SsuD/methylene tetrahydromethanopterin reductase-like flavin-dependent oxidoreductase (luciferase family)
MRFSIWPAAAQPFDDVLRIARHAAETGWDGVWFADHFMPNEPGATPVQTPVLEAGSVVAAAGRPVIAGTPEQLARAVAEHARIGLDELIVQTGPLGTGQQVLDAMDVLMSEVFG